MQTNVKTSFLDKKLTGVLETQPEGFVDIKYPNKVYKFRRSIVDLNKNLAY